MTRSWYTPVSLSKGYVCRSCIQSIRQRRRFATVTPKPTEVPEIFDVVCVGGGPAGLSLLTALRASQPTSNLKVALVETRGLDEIKRWKLPPDQYSNRVSSLTPTSVGFLDEIGAWQHIDRSRIQSYTEMEVWDGVSDARISFDWQSTDRPVSTSTSSQTATQKIVAYMTENLNLSSALLSRLASLGGVSLFDNTRVGSISYGPETATVDLRTWPVLTLSSGQVIAARLLVGADGANSPVRTFAGIPSRGWDYNRHGVVATMQLSQPTTTNSAHDAIAYQRFLPTGPIALLPLPSNLATLVWTTTPSHAAFLKTLTLIDFTALVNAAFRLSPTDIAYMHTIPSAQTDELTWRLSHTAPAGGRIPALAIGVQSDSIASFPLKMRHADAYTGQRIALVGDAAHSIHPLAGQGLNQGQLDIQALYSTIRTALANGSDIGAPLSIEDYPNERYAKNNTLLGVVDKLHKLYGTENPLVVGARSLGLRAVNGLGPLKGILMDVASGGSSARGAKTY